MDIGVLLALAFVVGVAVESIVARLVVQRSYVGNRPEENFSISGGSRRSSR